MAIYREMLFKEEGDKGEEITSYHGYCSSKILIRCSVRCLLMMKTGVWGWFDRICVSAKSVCKREVIPKRDWGKVKE